MGHRGGLVEHQRHRAVFLRRQVHRTLYDFVGRILTGDDEVQIDMGEQPRASARRSEVSFTSQSRTSLRPFCRMDTTSIALQPPTDISTISIGLGSFIAGVAVHRHLVAGGRFTKNVNPSTHLTLACILVTPVNFLKSEYAFA